jgi:hypothetical protein
LMFVPERPFNSNSQCGNVAEGLRPSPVGVKAYGKDYRLPSTAGESLCH